MSVEEMSEKILAYIKQHGNATFAELSRVVGDEGKGDLCIEILPNLAIWAGMSESFVDAITAVRPKLDLLPCAAILYLADGAMLRLPVAKGKPPKGGYKSPKWVPCILKLKQPQGVIQ
jgi:hypothetical protein